MSHKEIILHQQFPLEFHHVGDVFEECPGCLTPEDETKVCVLIWCGHRYCYNCAIKMRYCNICGSDRPLHVVKVREWNSFDQMWIGYSENFEKSHLQDEIYKYFGVYDRVSCRMWPLDDGKIVFEEKVSMCPDTPVMCLYPPMHIRGF